MQTFVDKSLLKKNIWKFYLSTFFGSWSFAAGFLVFYYRELGFSYFQIFALGIIYELLNFILEIPTGVLADFWSRKRVIVLGHLISALSFFIVLINPKVYVTYVIWSVLSAVCTTLNSGSYDAYIYDTVKGINPDDYPRILSRLSAITLLTQAASFLIGGWVADSLGFRAALLLSGIGGILQTLIILTTYELPVVKEEMKMAIDSGGALLRQFTRQISASFQALFGNLTTRIILTYSILFFLIKEFVRVIYQPYFSDLGYSTKTAISLISAGFLSISAISGIIIGQIKTQRNEKYLLLIFSFGLSLPLLVLGFTNIGLIAFILFYIALGAVQVVVPDIMNRLIPSDKRATILSAQNQLGSLGYAIFAVVIGKLLDKGNITTTALIVGLSLMLVFSILSVQFTSKGLKT